MSRHVDERIEDYVLGTLTLAERSEVEQHLVECRSCADLSKQLEPAMRSLPTVLPAPPGVLERLERALAGPGRFSHFVDRLAALFDLPPARIQALLERIDDPTAWEGGMAPGLKIMIVDAGPAREGFLSGFLALEPGATYPEHGHGDEEQVLVLEGGYRCSTGVEKWRGELDVRTKASPVHSFTALPDGPCICAGVNKPPEL